MRRALLCYQSCSLTWIIPIELYRSYRSYKTYNGEGQIRSHWLAGKTGTSGHEDARLPRVARCYGYCKGEVLILCGFAMYRHNLLSGGI